MNVMKKQMQNLGWVTVFVLLGAIGYSLYQSPTPANAQGAGVGVPRLLWVASSDAPWYARRLASYTCDGTDDQVEINAALAVGGSEVKLIGSTFSTSADIVMPSNSHLSGQGVTVTLAASSDTPVVTNSDPPGGNTNITISGDITFDHNGVNQSVSSHGIYFENVTGFRLEDIKVTGGRGWDVRLEDCHQGDLVRVESYGPGGANNQGGIQTRNNCRHIRFDSCVIRDHNNGSGYGLWIMGTYISAFNTDSLLNDDDNLVVGNSAANDARHITYIGGYLGDSISDAGCHVTSGSSDVLFVGTRLPNNALIGMKVGGTNIFRVRMKDLSCTNNGSHGASNSVDGTVFDGGDFSFNGGRGLFQSGSGDGVRYLNLTADGNTDSNIEVHSTATVNDLLIANCFLINSSDWAIDLNGTIDEVMVLSNFIEGNVSGGIDGGGVATGVTTNMNWGAQKPADSDQRD